MQPDIDLTEELFERILEPARNFTVFLEDFTSGKVILSPVALRNLKFMTRQFVTCLKDFKTSYIFGSYTAGKDFLYKIRLLTQAAMVLKEKADKNLIPCNNSPESQVLSNSIYLKAKALYKGFKDAVSVLYNYIKDNNDSTLLVGSLRNSKQLSIAIKYGFYHIPKTLVEHPEDIKCIAVYQSRNLFSENSGIRYYGKVEAYREVPRYEIKYIPSESDEIYVLFEIKEWKALKKPIKADYMGSPCIYTNLYRFMHCEKASELTLSPDEHKVFLFMNNFINTKNRGFTAYKSGMIEYNGENFEVSVQGKTVFKVTGNRFNSGPVSVIKAISAMLD